MAVSKRLRFEVLQRDGFACRYCHRTDLPLVVDHVIPVALGGADLPENLVASCEDCNRGKASASPDRSLVAGVTDDAIRWADAMQQAGEVQRSQHDALERYRADFEQAWKPRSLPMDWRNTVDRWFELGIEIDLIYDCIDIAFRAYVTSYRWNYFCGVVWKRVTERQDIARALLDEEASQDGA